MDFTAQSRPPFKPVIVRLLNGLTVNSCSRFLCLAPKPLIRSGLLMLEATMRA